MNNYHLYEEIGHGKHSTVYKGRRRGTIEYVAIKSIDKSKRSRVLTEVSISSDLIKPSDQSQGSRNVCLLHNWYETRNHLWIVSEYCAGGDLARVLKEDEKILPESQLRSLAAEIVNGLIQMHACGIVFADLKPSNVLFTESGTVKLSGFSVSQRLSELESALSENKQVPRRGSPFYMAPELFLESGCHSFSSDIYALGVVLFEMTCGRTPYSSCTTFADLQRSVLATTVLTPELSEGSEELRHLVARMLVKDPSDRIMWTELVAHPLWRDVADAARWKRVVDSHISTPESRFRQSFLITRMSLVSRRRGSSYDASVRGKESRSVTPTYAARIPRSARG